MFDFRQKIYSLTQVKPESQKLIGLVKGKLPAKDDLQRFGSLGLSHSRVKFTMVGTPEEESFELCEPSEPTVRPRAGASSQLTALSIRKPSISCKIDSQASRREVSSRRCQKPTQARRVHREVPHHREPGENAGSGCVEQKIGHQ